MGVATSDRLHLWEKERYRHRLSGRTKFAPTEQRRLRRRSSDSVGVRIMSSDKRNGRGDKAVLEALRETFQKVEGSLQPSIDSFVSSFSKNFYPPYFRGSFAPQIC